MRKLTLAAIVPVLFVSSAASAHFNLMAPTATAKANTGGGKGSPPCGPDTGNGDVTPVMGGSELTITLAETVPHDGFYRVALGLTRDMLPPDNVVYDKAGMILPPTGIPSGTPDHTDFSMPPKFPVLADNLFPHTGAPPPTFTTKVTLPNVTCEKCTLQVIEYMDGHGFNGPTGNPPTVGGGYFYHHCADLKITADPGKPPFDPSGAGGGGNGGAAAGGTGGAAAGGGGAGGAGTAGVATGGTGTAGVATGGAGAATGGAPTATGGAGTGSGGTPATAGAAGAIEHTKLVVDDGGCGIAKRTQGGASLLAALGLVFALVRRRRAR